MDDVDDVDDVDKLKLCFVHVVHRSPCPPVPGSLLNVPLLRHQEEWALQLD